MIFREEKCGSQHEVILWDSPNKWYNSLIDLFLFEISKLVLDFRVQSSKINRSLSIDAIAMLP